MIQRAITVRRGGVWSSYAKRQRNKLFLAYAGEFFRASLKTGSPLVRAFLLGHALELLLKTYLLASGFGEKALRRIGHDLSSLLKECRKMDIDELVLVTSKLEKVIEKFSELFSSGALRYSSSLHLLSPPVLPDLRSVRRFAGRLNKALVARVRIA